MFEPFLAGSSTFPLHFAACSHLQAECYEGPQTATGNSRWWTGPNQMVYRIGDKWSCEYCARKAGLLW